MDSQLNNVELVIYTGIFTSLVTTFFSILLKRFDSREAENNRKKNAEIAKSNREYEIRVTLREKYEKLMVCTVNLDVNRRDFSNLKGDDKYPKFLEIIELVNNIKMYTSLYFPELIADFSKLKESHRKYNDFIDKAHRNKNIETKKYSMKKVIRTNKDLCKTDYTNFKHAIREFIDVIEKNAKNFTFKDI